MRKDDIDGQCHHLLYFLWPHDDDDECEAVRMVVCAVALLPLDPRERFRSFLWSHDSLARLNNGAFLMFL
jgi:hypothetical protein